MLQKLFFFMTLFLLPFTANADPLDNWHWRHPVPQGNTLYGVTYGNGTFVAVGEYGAIVTSSDGVTWTARYSGTDIRLTAVAYGNGTFVAVGRTGPILTSPDGITWTARESEITFEYFDSIIYGNSTFVAVSSHGPILTSPDGVTWTVRYKPNGTDLRGIACGNGTFVVTGWHTPLFDSQVGAASQGPISGDKPYGIILTSPDGITWTTRNPGPGISYFHGVVHGNGLFMAFSDGGIITSSDGALWTAIGPQPGYIPSDSVTGAVYGSHIFVAVEYRNGAIHNSPDGVAWTSVYSGTSFDNLFGVAYGNGTFVTVGSDGTILTSTDGATWTDRLSGPTAGLGDVAYGNGSFVATGSYFHIPEEGFFRFPVTTGVLLTSPDGVEWTSINPGITAESFDGIAYGNGTFVVAGSGGTILTSADGAVWTARNSGTTDNYAAVAFGNGIFLITGYGGKMLTSSDGISWTVRNSGSEDDLRAVAYGNGTFAVMGGDGTILTSPDGVAWTTRNSGMAYLSHVAYGGGVFAATGQNLNNMSLSVIITSADGVTWTPIYTADLGESIRSIAYGAGQFVAMGSNGNMLTSTDGVAWTSRKVSINAHDLGGAVYGNGTFVAVGWSGAIIQSDPFATSCDAVVSSTLKLHVPIVESDDKSHYWADFSYVPDTMDFALTGFGALSDTSPFSECRPAALSADLKLHVPRVTAGDASYWADLQYSHDLIFTLNGAGQY